MKLVTVFTPTYNRALMLPRLYKSLLEQSNRDFIWLIVDDGSVDNTAELADIWKREAKIQVEYFRQENQGKHIAHNKGVDLCNTPIFFCVDSDDILTPDAVQTISYLHNEERNKVLGFYLRKGDASGKPAGRNWPKSVKYVHLNELYQKYGFEGESAIVLNTALIKGYQFPKFDNEKFVTEAVFYDLIDGIAKMRLVDKVCYLYEYGEDGYTLSGAANLFRNPIGTGYYYLTHIMHISSVLEKAKLMGMFLAWKELLGLKEPAYESVKVGVMTRILGRLLKRHYKKLFREQKEKLS